MVSNPMNDTRDELMNQLTLPASVYTSVLLIPLLACNNANSYPFLHVSYTQLQGEKVIAILPLMVAPISHGESDSSVRISGSSGQESVTDGGGNGNQPIVAY